MYQKLITIGNLGKDPEMRYTPDGKSVTSFSVAVDDSYVSNGEKVKRTMWVRVSVWGKAGEACNNYLHKGSKVFVEGTLNVDAATGGPRLWSGGDGTLKASFEMTAREVRFLDPKQAGGVVEAEPSEEDIPF